MDDLTAFERQIRDEMRAMAGPLPRTDVEDIVHTARAATSTIATTTARQRLQPMLNATGFVAAGVVVTLFGGFLLAGTLLTQPSDESVPAVGALASVPTETEPAVVASADPEPSLTPTSGPKTTAHADLLPGVDLVTEEVAAGVLRVVSDGIRDLASQPIPSCWSLEDRSEQGVAQPLRYDEMSAGKVVAGLDDSIWLFWGDRFVRLGDERTGAWTAGQVPALGDDIEVSPDGTLWHAPSWGTGVAPPGKTGQSQGSTSDIVARVVKSIAIGATAPEETEQDWLADRIARLRENPEQFEQRPECLEDISWLTEAAPDGALRSHRDGEWRMERQEVGHAVKQVEVGPDDTIWAAWNENRRRNHLDVFAARLDAGGWRNLEALPRVMPGPLDALVVSRDGTVLMQSQRNAKPEGLWRLVVDPRGPALGHWEPLEAPNNFHEMVASSEGTVWGSTSPNAIARLDDDGWTEWDLAEMTDPVAPRYLGGGRTLAVSDDGSVWLKARRDEDTSGCNGIYDFDGTAWSHFLRELCVRSVDISPDGLVWLRAGGPDGPVDLYVIRPDATVASIS